MGARVLVPHDWQRHYYYHFALKDIFAENNEL